MESNTRSIVKAISWRFWGTADTILISLLITQKIISAAQIGILEVFTKLFLFYIHERVWNFSYRNVSRIQHHVIIVKSVTWRVVGTLDTLVIAYLITGTLTWATSIASIELITKLVLFYIHEKIWENISWGRKIELNLNKK